MSYLRDSFSEGYSCLSAWSDLLDQINVFPVADGDTGTNLRISLAPLRDHANGITTEKKLLRCATGNSGNIAAAFFREFCHTTDFSELAERAAAGNKNGWKSVAEPCEGTMLSIFDNIAATLSSHKVKDTIYPHISSGMQKAVLDTTMLLPQLQKAGVVDSGALAMYIFFEGFFRKLTHQSAFSPSILDVFKDKLSISSTFQAAPTDSHCVDAVIQLDENQENLSENLSTLGDSLVVVEEDSTLKVHVHTPEPGRFRSRLDEFGKILRWNNEKIVQNESGYLYQPTITSPLHIITDAAGSIPRKIARKHNITLLDSYIISGGNSRPESLCDPEQIYRQMRRGEKITTAQASTFERHQHYQSICQQFGRSLYLCVGSAFTGNYATAKKWQETSSSDNLLTVIDTGAASGRLALIALLAARYSRSVDNPKYVIAFAHLINKQCEEFVFIDELKYLVAGGRLTKTSGFFGDLLHMKPIITPTSDGAQKVGVVHSRKGQLGYAVKKITEKFNQSSRPLILLQYSDNEDWVKGRVKKMVGNLLPKAEILFTPLSLTSGVHMGPGTWSLAFGPDLIPFTEAQPMTEQNPS